MMTKLIFVLVSFVSFVSNLFGQSYLPPPATNQPTATIVAPSTWNTFTPPVNPQAAVSTTAVISSYNSSAQPNNNITVTGKLYKFIIFGETKNTNMCLSEVAVQKTSPYGYIITIPSNEPANSLYLLWPIGTSSAGLPVVINQTTATWLSSSQSSANQTITVYGKNLSNKANIPLSWIFLQQAGAKRGYWATTTFVNNYKVSFTVSNIPIGIYQVWVNNGLGGNYSWSTPLSLTIVNNTPTPNTTINVTQYGATGNGITDDGPAILKAIAALPNIGGILYFPANTYLIGNEQIDIPSNVTVLGDGPTKSILLFTADLNVLYKQTYAGAYAIGTTDNGVKNVEFSSICLTYSGPTNNATSPNGAELIRQRFSSGLTLNNVSLISPNIWNVDWLGSSQSQIINSSITGQCVWLLNANNIDVSGNKFYLANTVEAAVTVWNGHNIEISNNTVQNYNDSNNTVAGWGQGRLLENGTGWGSIYNEYVANNSTINMGYPTGSDNGEQINNEGTIDSFYGSVVSSTNNTITINTNTAPPVGYNFIITNGTGIGQMKVVTNSQVSGNNTTLTLNSNLTILPDSTSKIDVCSTVYNSIFYNNTLSDRTDINGATPAYSPTGLWAATGFEVWNGGYNLTFDSNTVNNVNNGVLLCNDSVHNPCYYIDIINNNINNAKEYGIVYQPEIADTDPDFVGVAIRNNTINTSPIGISLERNNKVGTVTLSEIENNTITNCPTTIAAFTNPTTLIKP